jgi:uncharacterized membrane protein AbrB (regulator of aidB expression)
MSLATKGEWLVGVVVLVLLICYVLLCYCFTTERVTIMASSSMAGAAPGHDWKEYWPGTQLSR